MWEFILDISDGDVADKGILGLQGDWSTVG